jgi:hypothetical protein
MKPGDIVQVPNTNFYVDELEWLFGTETRPLHRFKLGSALVISIEFCTDGHERFEGVELMDSRGKTGWTDRRLWP